METTERQQLFTDLKLPNVFVILEKNSETKLKEIYGAIVQFGPQSLGQDATDRQLAIVTYILTQKQNRNAFRIMAVLTLISIGLALVQTIPSIRPR
jgi:hypothetical protein